MIDPTESWGLTDAEREKVKAERGVQYFSAPDVWNLDQAICASVSNGLVLLSGSPWTHLDDEALKHAGALGKYARELHETWGEDREKLTAGAQDALRWVADNLSRLWD